jgi:uncharacterized membrane protein YphA (DoxX/SURF4 family)
MSWYFTGFLLALFGLSLILISLSLWLLRGTGGPSETYSPFARFFLIALRVCIGWHCFIEGMEKISTPSWSSEAYLREASGPFAGVYRAAAGDRLIDKLALGSDDTFPPELDRQWRDYLHAFAAYYELDADQTQRAEEILKARETATLKYLTSKAEPVTKLAPYPPDLTVDMTMKQRLEEHERLLERVRTAEAKFPTDDKDVHAEWKAAKADLANWRGELKRSIDAQTDKLKRIDEKFRETVNKSIAALEKKIKDAKDAKAAEVLTKELDAEKAKLWEPLTDVLSSEQKLKGPLPEPIQLPFTSWRLMETSDFLVKWGLVVLGACLMLGFLSRLSSVATGLLVLSFYLAMPPLPGWPESPRLEGHYLLINKTLIEIVALFALACIPTGRWAGIDGLFGLFCRKKTETPLAA